MMPSPSAFLSRETYTWSDFGAGGRRPLAPELVDQHVGRDDVPGAKHEHREDAPLLAAAEVEQPVARFEHSDRPEDPELH